MIRTHLRTRVLFGTLVLLAACGHDGGIGVRLPPQPGDPEPARITGGVLAPQAIFAAAASFLDRCANLLLPPAAALSSIVQPIGSTERVSLQRLVDLDAADGTIDDPLFVSANSTEFGRYSVPLEKGSFLGECGLFVQIGSGPTLMRGLVYNDDQDLSAVSEAVVRLILDFRSRAFGTTICNFSLDEIATLVGMVANVTATTGAANVQQLNQLVAQIAFDTPAIVDAVEEFGAN